VQGHVQEVRHIIKSHKELLHCNGNSTFMCLWAIYIVPGSVHIFPRAEKADPSWEYIICSQTHECGNWDWGPDRIPFLRIFVSNFTAFCICSVVTKMHMHTHSDHSSLTYEVCKTRPFLTVSSFQRHHKVIFMRSDFCVGDIAVIKLSHSIILNTNCKAFAHWENKYRKAPSLDFVHW
jgi:hypothetical protein